MGCHWITDPNLKPVKMQLRAKRIQGKRQGVLRVGQTLAFVESPSTLAWKIPWMEEAGRLQSMGSLRVRHDGATSLSLFTFVHWRRKWQPTPVFLPGESQGRGSLVGCRLQSRTRLKRLSSSSNSPQSEACQSVSH